MRSEINGKFSSATAAKEEEAEEEGQVRPKLPLGPPKEERRRRSPVKRNCALLLLQYPSALLPVPPPCSKGALKTGHDWELAECT